MLGVPIWLIVLLILASLVSVLLFGDGPGKPK
jgi:hypothetical protein